MTDKQTEALRLAKELDGVIADVEEGKGFDDVCLDTIKYVRDALAEQPNIDKYLEKDNSEQQAQQQEPFGYFKAEPFGWTDCAETDEGAIALYERPQPAQPSKPWVELTEEDYVCISQLCEKKLEAAEYAEHLLREKNA